MGKVISYECDWCGDPARAETNSRYGDESPPNSWEYLEMLDDSLVCNVCFADAREAVRRVKDAKRTALPISDEHDPKGLRK